MSLIVIKKKPVFGFPTRSDTNQAVQLQKIARGLKCSIKGEKKGCTIYEGHPISSDNDAIKQNLSL